MRHNFSAYLDNAISLILLVVAGITPLLFLNQTTEFYEMPKLVFLSIATIVLLGLWIFSWILKGKIVITRTPLDIPLLVLLAVVLLSTYFSDSRYVAIYGSFPKVHGSAISWVTYIRLYFVTVSNLNTVGKIRNFLYALYTSGVIVAVVTLLSYFHVFLPFDFAQTVNFTPTGSSFSTIAFLLLLLPLPLFSIINPSKYLPLPLALGLSVLFGLTIALIGALPTYIALVVAFALCFLVAKPQEMKETLVLFLIPVIVSVLAIALSYLPGNPVQQLSTNFPREIQLPFATSWKVSASAFRDAPFIGTGPATYLFNFTSYKPIEFNSLKFWNFSFDTAYDEFLQVLGTLGVLGLLALLAVCLVTLNASRNNMISAASSEAHNDTLHSLLPALAVSGLFTIVLFAIHATTVVSIVVTLFVLAALMVSQRATREHVMELSLGIKASTADNRHFDLLPVIVFVLFLIAAVPALYRGVNIVRADYYHRLALAQASKSGTLTYQYLQKAESLNPVIDLYRVDMAQTNFALANAIASQKGPTKDNPKGTLTDQDKKTIQTLLSQSINEARASVAISPRSSRNWEVLAAIYRNIAGVAQNALTFSLDAYGRAIQRDPLNPALRINVGGIYYTIKNYDLAIRFYSDAANLKPDYANAYYNLAIALRDKGDLQNAKTVADQALALLKANKNTQDYKVVSQLVSDINAKTPAQQGNTALQGSGVNVNDLNNPPSEVATPAAVTKNPNAKLPQLTPTKAPARR